MKNKSLNQKMNCIIDTDPGVDDSAALALSLYDEKMDIKLITTVNGNLSLDIVTRNALHLLEKFNRTDIPLAKGASRPMKKEPKDAIFIHQKHGTGNYIPPKQTKLKPINKTAVEAMYETIKANKNNISLILLGPTTNAGQLITTHPDVVGMINHIYYEGSAAYGHKIEKNWKNYISFNASSDPDALKIVIESGIPLTIVPSRMGRDLANFTEQEVDFIKNINDTGKWIHAMYSGYWEHGYTDRRVATNDTCAVLNMRCPKLFKTKRAFVTIDTETHPGKMTYTFSKKGNVEYVYKVNRKKLHEFFFDAVRKLDKYEFVEYEDFDETLVTLKPKSIKSTPKKTITSKKDSTTKKPKNDINKNSKQTFAKTSTKQQTKK